jgi:transcriptional antiterminator RfaH
VRQGFEVYLPTLKNEKILKKGFTTKVEPLFSRYLFVSLSSHKQNFSLIRSTRGVSGLVSFSHQPSRLSSEVIDALRAFELQTSSSLGAKVFESGDAVKIFSGPLKGLEGIYRGQSGSQRGLVLIDFLSKSHTVSVDFSDIRPLPY